MRHRVCGVCMARASPGIRLLHGCLSVCRAPDLTRDPSEPQTVHVPFHTGNSLLEREGAKRRQPIARLHCKAFQFPVSFRWCRVHLLVSTFCTQQLSIVIIHSPGPTALHPWSTVCHAQILLGDLLTANLLPMVASACICILRYGILRCFVFNKLCVPA